MLACSVTKGSIVSVISLVQDDTNNSLESVISNELGSMVFENVIVKLSVNPKSLFSKLFVRINGSAVAICKIIGSLVTVSPGIKSTPSSKAIL